MARVQLSLGDNWLSEVDNSVRPLAESFAMKLMTDDTAPGLHIEPMKNPADSRVRTGRVNDFWRAVMFKVTSEHGALYFIEKVYPHDKANEIAPRLTMNVNPVTGVPQCIELAPTELPVPPSYVQREFADNGVKPEEKVSFLSAWGSTVERLVSELGFAEDVAQLAMDCTDQDQIIDLAERVSGLPSDMLLSLGAGHPISEVRDEFELDDAQEFIKSLEDETEGPGVDLTSDEALVKAAQRTLSKAQFTLVEGEDELARVIEAGDFGAWRVFLHPTQRNYVDAQYGGAARLSGGAGTGKTVVLLHRAARLHRSNPEARIVLTTYNKTLAQMLADNLLQLDNTLPLVEGVGEPGMLVRGVDALAAAVLRDADSAELAKVSQELLGRIYSTKTQPSGDGLWNVAASALPSETDERIANASFLRSEYENVILARGISTQSEYRRVRRPGRGIALDRGRRDSVWKAIEAYQLSAGDAFSFAERLALATAYLQATQTHVADHVLVDEGQDFSATHWGFVRALVAPGPNDIYIAEDANQRIYAQKIVLGHYGIPIVGRSRRLSLNYRTTQQNLKYAVGILEGAEFEDLEGEGVDGSRIISARFGPEPKLIKSSHLGDAVEQTVQLIAGWREVDGDTLQSIAVLLPKRVQADKLEVALAAAGIKAKFIESNTVGDPGVIQLMTMHRSKGMEFSRVILFRQGDLLGDLGVGSGGMAREDASDEQKEQEIRNRSLVYVASTRARDELVIVE